ncbi:Hypothetical predicted protein [Lecanosticta acicola]|uniref:Uncharacterized protein n=1 Tax=Lecanosticta acicola TaxID=111012 RepID=A0AAI9E8M7_9PEZI|nr:Hypothetical predicted protein [Lecanosticta acicola]
MPTATRNLYNAGAKLPKLRTGYQTTISKSSSSSPSPSTSTPSKQLAIPMGTSRELPMPIVTRITSLGQAQATLQHCATKLSRSWQSNPGRSSPPPSPIDAYGRRHFQQWLEQWEQAFTAYLSFAMPSMKTEDITQCRVLKANHLSCTILASQGSSFDKFDSEFQAIVELAGAVLQSRRQKPNSRSQSPEAFSEILDVREPLYVVAARCDRASTRAQAMELIRRGSPR